MAKSKDEITTKFTCDTSDLTKGLSEATRNIKHANAEFAKSTAGLDDWTKSSEGIKAKLKQLSSTLTEQNQKVKLYSDYLAKLKGYLAESNKEVDNNKKALEQAKSQYGANSEEAKKYSDKLKIAEQTNAKLVKSIADTEDKLTRQETTVIKTEKDIKKYEEELQLVSIAEKKVGTNANDVAKELQKMEQCTETSSKGFTIMKGALASLVADGFRLAINSAKNFIRDTARVGIEFSSAMSKVKAISGVTGYEFEMLRDKAKELGETTVFSATEAAEGMVALAQSGWKTQEIINGIGGVLNVAAAGGVELSRASEIVSTGLQAMGKGASEANHFVDILAATASNSNTDIELMGGSMNYAAQIAGSFKYSLEDTALAIGLMAKSGINGEKAGTALRAMLTRLSTGTRDAGKELENLQIEIKNSDGTMRPLGDVISDLRTKFSEMSDSEKSSAAFALAGQRAMGGLLAIVNASPAEFDRLKTAIDNSSGAGDKMAKIMLDNLGGDLKLLGDRVDSFKLKLMEKLEPSLRKIVAGVQNLLSEHGALMNMINYTIKHGQTIATVLKTIIGIGVAAKVLLLVGRIKEAITIMNAMKSATTTAGVAAAMYSGSLGGMATANTILAAKETLSTIATTAHSVAMGVLTTAIKLCTGAFAALSVALGPVGAAITLAGAAVGGAIMLVNGLSSSLNNAKKEEEELSKVEQFEADAKERATRAIEKQQEAHEKAEEAREAYNDLINKHKRLEEELGDALKENIEAQKKYNEIIDDANSQYEGYLDAVDRHDDALKKLKEIQKETGLSGEALAKQVEEGSKTYEEMSEKAKKVYRAYFDVQQASNKLTESSQTLNDAQSVLNFNVEQASKDLATNKLSLSDLTQAQRDLVSVYEEQMEKQEIIKYTTEEIAKTYNWSAEELQKLYESVQNQTRAESDLNEEEKKAYEIVKQNIEMAETEQKSNEDVAKSIDEAAEASKRRLLQDIKTDEAHRITVKNLDEYAKNVHKAYEEGYLSAEEAKDKITTALDEVGGASYDILEIKIPGYKDKMVEAFEDGEIGASDFERIVNGHFYDLYNGTEKTCEEDIPDSIKSLFKTQQYENSKEGFSRWFNGFFDDMVYTAAKNTGKILGKIGSIFSGHSEGGVITRNHAKGGTILRKPTVIDVAGEAGAEAIVPLERNKYWIKRVADEMVSQLNLNVAGGGDTINNITNNYTQTINAPKQPSRLELYRQSKNLLQGRMFNAL